MSELRPIASIVAEALVGLEPHNVLPTLVLPRPTLAPLPASAAATAVR